MRRRRTRTRLRLSMWAALAARGEAYPGVRFGGGMVGLDACEVSGHEETKRRRRMCGMDRRFLFVRLMSMHGDELRCA